VQERKLILRRLGVEAYRPDLAPAQPVKAGACLVLLSVGRLHPVKNHTFLLEACALLKACGANLLCLIAGDGPEQRRLQWQIAALDLKREVKLLGHVPHDQIESLYPLVDVVVLTSKSEGIPLVLMEAMAHGKPVLAPAITGIPELVRDGKTGFLYRPGAVEDFVARVEVVRSSLNALGPLRRAAREHVRVNFNRELNLQDFADALLERISPQVRICHENPVLQQI
jgi:glycosyltransferase involved in cell wall biosynthesis